jgi:hypothetical protein
MRQVNFCRRVSCSITATAWRITASQLAQVWLKSKLPSTPKSGEHLPTPPLQADHEVVAALPGKGLLHPTARPHHSVTHCCFAQIAKRDCGSDEGRKYGKKGKGGREAGLVLILGI